MPKISAFDDKLVLGIDPGLSGAFVWFSPNGITYEPMPLNAEKRVDFVQAQALIQKFPLDHVFIERAMPMAMGAKHAFNYGQDFKSLLLALELSFVSFTLIEPSKWTKVIHAGVSADLKPKAKSLVAAKRLVPKFLNELPKGKVSGKIDEGGLDALLIAYYGYHYLIK